MVYLLIFVIIPSDNKRKDARWGLKKQTNKFLRTKTPIWIPYLNSVSVSCRFKKTFLGPSFMWRQCWLVEMKTSCFCRYLLYLYLPIPTQGYLEISIFVRVLTQRKCLESNSWGVDFISVLEVKEQVHWLDSSPFTGSNRVILRSVQTVLQRLFLKESTIFSPLHSSSRKLGKGGKDETCECIPLLRTSAPSVEQENSEIQPFVFGC